jgi:hypothetical protein
MIGIFKNSKENKVGKALFPNEQLEFTISPLLAIARDYNSG